MADKKPESPFVTRVTGSSLDLDFIYDEDAPENLDADGNLKSEWLPGEPIILLVAIFDDIKILRAAVSDGNIQRAHSQVVKDQTEQAEFYSEQREYSLKYSPHGEPVYSFYQTANSNPAITRDGLTLTAADFSKPSILEINYQARFEQWKYTPPGGLTLESEDDSFLIAAELFVEADND